MLKNRYTIVCEHELYTFEQKVEELLNNGWQLAGGVSKIGIYFTQALTFTKEKSDVAED